MTGHCQPSHKAADPLLARDSEISSDVEKVGYYRPCDGLFEAAVACRTERREIAWVRVPLRPLKFLLSTWLSHIKVDQSSKKDPTLASVVYFTLEVV